jgi:hypothetical protein
MLFGCIAKYSDSGARVGSASAVGLGGGYGLTARSVDAGSNFASSPHGRIAGQLLEAMSVTAVTNRAPHPGCGPAAESRCGGRTRAGRRFRLGWG